MFQFLYGRSSGKRAERIALNAFAALLVISVATANLAPLAALAQTAENEVGTLESGESESTDLIEEHAAHADMPASEPVPDAAIADIGDGASDADAPPAEVAESDPAPSDDGITRSETAEAEESAAPTTEDGVANSAVETAVSATTTDSHSATTPEQQETEGGDTGVIEAEASADDDASLSGSAETTTDDGEDGTNTETASGSSQGGGGGSTSVTTGNGTGLANVVNVVNTGIFNSVGSLLFLNNLFGGFSGLFDLRTFFASAFGGGSRASSTATCSLSSCDAASVNASISASSTARIVNDIIVRAMTGGNTAVATGGSASIDTGDAYAAANVVNVANTNITNSNYLLVSVTNFGDLAGDIVLPGKSFFENLFFGNRASSTIPASTSVETDNDASIGNGLEVAADSGGNSASSTDGEASIATGAARAESGVVNSVNRNFFNSNALVLLFRVYGDWSGSVVGAPEGIRWRESGSGIELWHDPSAATTTLTASAGNAFSCCAGSVEVENSNMALIDNSVSVLALTGDNRAEGDEGASITTGDAYAGASIVNIANTNIFGSNFIFAIFNIFGNWSGNIAFGQPDLWIGGRIETSAGKVERGGSARFNYTIANRGDADAHRVRLRNAFPSRVFDFHDAMDGDAAASWDIGTIPAGQVVEVSYDAAVREVPMGESLIESRATVESEESDGNTADNTETLSIVTTSGSWSDGSGAHVTYTPDPDLRITKTNSATGALTASSTVDYSISIENVGVGPAYHATLTDTIKHQEGGVIYEQDWPLGTIKAGEEITVTYRVEYNEATKPGTYVNYAQVKAIGRHPSENPFYGSVADSGTAMSAIQIVAEDEEATDVEVSTSTPATGGTGGIGETEEGASALEVGPVTDGTSSGTTTAATQSGNDEGQAFGDAWLSGDADLGDAGDDPFSAFGPVQTAEAAGFSDLNQKISEPSFLQSAVAALAGDAPYWLAGAVLAFLLVAFGFRRGSSRGW